MKALICFLVLSLSAVADMNISRVQFLKENIVELASGFQGLGDPDSRIQKQLEPLVEELVTLTNPPPVQQRLPLLYGVWKQVWGPYDYRNNDRGVDPTLETKEIYQVISPKGFYYNVSPNYKKGDRNRVRTNYLKGVYKLSKNNSNGLDVRFDKFVAIPQRPEGNIYDYVNEAENDRLPGQITVLPKLFVKLFFGGGTLIEVYTDEDIRILYGSNGSNFKNKYLYIMTKVNSALRGYRPGEYLP